MDDLRHINALIYELKESLKDIESISHTDFSKIQLNGKNKEWDLAFLIDRIDTDKAITKEVLEDLIDQIFEHNSRVTSQIEKLLSLENEIQELRELRHKLEVREDILKRESSSPKIVNKNVNTLNNNSGNSGSSSKPKTGFWQEFLHTTTGRVALLLILLIILVQLGFTPESIIDIIKGNK